MKDPDRHTDEHGGESVSRSWAFFRNRPVWPSGEKMVSPRGDDSVVTSRLPAHQRGFDRSRSYRVGHLRSKRPVDCDHRTCTPPPPPPMAQGAADRTTGTVPDNGETNWPQLLHEGRLAARRGTWQASRDPPRVFRDDRLPAEIAVRNRLAIFADRRR